MLSNFSMYVKLTGGHPRGNFDDIEQKQLWPPLHSTNCPRFLP